MVTGCWISSSPLQTQFKIHTYHTKLFDHLELEHLYIFNPTKLTNLFASWYHATKKSIPVACALIGPSIDEQIIAVATAHPTPDQLPLQAAAHIEWQYTYLYSYDMAHYFYLCSMTKPLLFQYQLMSIRAQIPLQTITTQTVALLNAYRAIFGAAFRPAQLAVALATCDTTIEQLFSRDDLGRLCALDSSIPLTEADSIPLLASCGLFASEIA